MFVQGLLLVLLAAAVPIHSLQCYECVCSSSDATSCSCDITTEYFDQDYCVIIEQKYIDSTYVELYRIPRNATWLTVADPYFILIIESIRYNVTAADWYLWPSAVIYGCDWDLCNSPSLISILPNSFALSIDKTWLNTNIYGSGSVSSCYSCPGGLCTVGQNPFNVSQCPLTTCVNVTSCLAYDLWYDLNTDQQCYQSDCAPTYLDGPGAEDEGGKYKIDIEAVVYLAQNRSNYEIWEIDVYCSAENCTRSTIFQEIKGVLSGNVSNLSAFPVVRPIITTTTALPTTSTPISDPLTCYQCDSPDTTTCTSTSTAVISANDGYCIIIRESFGQTVFVYSDAYSYSNSDFYLSEFPYTLVEESITYDELSGLWSTQTNLVVYGCNWNLCNKPSLVPLLPNTFQMRLPESWLNASILGSGQPARDCHQCPDSGYCGTTDYLDANVCPVQSCNRTCFLFDAYDDPANNFLCYQSYCLSPEDDSNPINRHRIEIEAAVYASEQNVVDIWEVDIYCRADNCSSPRIFRDLREQLTVQIGNLAALFNETYDPTIPQRRCYECFCSDTSSCSCGKITVKPADTTYCVIDRMNIGQAYYFDLGHIDVNSTRVYIRDFPYLLLGETILYNEQTAVWNTITDYVIYGCDWDLCNDPGLVPFLPTSFQMRLPESWLNTNVLGTGQLIRDCHDCPDAPQCGSLSFLDAGRCPIRACNTTCIVSDTFDDPANDLQCYQSRCVPFGGDGDPYDRHRVEIEGILYLSNQPRSVEIWEVDIYCRADDCSRPEIFTELNDQLSVDYGDLSIFDRFTSTTTITTTTTTTSSTVTPSSTVAPSTTESTTTGHASMMSNLNFFIILLASIISLNFY